MSSSSSGPATWRAGSESSSSATASTSPVAFTVHADYTPGDKLEGLPVVAFEELADSHSPDRCSVFVASGYREMNRLRADVCAQARERGYELPNVICPTASVYGTLGDNVAVSPGVAVMPHASVGAGTILGANAIVSHDAAVGEYCYLAGQAAVLGRARVGDRCFIGADATIRNEVKRR